MQLKLLFAVLFLLTGACAKNKHKGGPSLIGPTWKLIGFRCSNTPEVKSQKTGSALGPYTRTLKLKPYRKFSDSWVFGSSIIKCPVDFSGSYGINGNQVIFSFDKVTGIEDAGTNCGIAFDDSTSATFNFNINGSKLELSNAITDKTATISCPVGEQSILVFEE